MRSKNWPLRAAFAMAWLRMLGKEGVGFAPTAAKWAGWSVLGALVAFVTLSALGTGTLMVLSDRSDKMISISPAETERWVMVAEAVDSGSLEKAALRAQESQRGELALVSGESLKALESRANSETEKAEAAQLQEAKTFIEAIKQGASVEEAAARLRAGAAQKPAPTLMAWANARARETSLANVGFVELFVSAMPGERGDRDQALFAAKGFKAALTGLIVAMMMALLALLGAIVWEASEGVRNRVSQLVEARREEIEAAVQAKALARVARKGKQGKPSGRL